MKDDGYQGRGNYGTTTLTPEQVEVADLSKQIASLEDRAQDAEDREQLGQASKLRKEIIPIKQRLDALLAARKA